MYQPKISDDNIRRLYQLRIKVQKPMTQVLDKILEEYFASHPFHANMEPEKKLQKIQFYNLACS